MQFSTCRRRRVEMEPNTTYVYGEKVVPMKESSTRDVNRNNCSWTRSWSCMTGVSYTRVNDLEKNSKHGCSHGYPGAS